MMLRLLTFRVLLCSLAALGFSACGEPEAVQAPSTEPMPVRVARPLVRSLVEWDRYTGRLAAIESVEVRARVSGYLESVHFEEGQRVQRGDLLAVIDPRPFQAERNRAAAMVEEAEASLERSKALLTQAEALETQAQSQFRLAASRLDNAKKAFETNAIAGEQLDVRESELAEAQATVEGAKAAMASATADIATARAGIETAKAALVQAELELGYTRVEASISGRISNRRVTRGNLIQGGSASSTLLTTIVSLDPIHVYFDADEQEYLKYVRLSASGDRPSSREAKNPVYLALIDEQGYPHQGHMDFVDNRIDPNTGTIRARAILRNADMVLTPGLFATVRIPGSARYDAVMVPDDSIGANQTVRFVYTLDDEARVQVTPVVPGPLQDGLRVIREGLDGSESIVIGGLQRVRPGMQVSPAEETLDVAVVEDGLPDDFQPLPPEEWIRAEEGSR